MFLQRLGLTSGRGNSWSFLLLGFSIGWLFTYTSRNSRGFGTVISSTLMRQEHAKRISNTFSDVLSMPSADQRYRVLQLLTHLSPRYTDKCHVNNSPIYRKQVADRYARLAQIPPSRRSSSKWSSLFSRDGTASKVSVPESHTYFFAINLYNSFDIIPDLFATLLRVCSILGFHNVYISIYENGSSDQTKAILQIFDSLTRSVGLRVIIKISQRTRGIFHHRIEYLAEVRNEALTPLHELRDKEGETFDTVLFLNDVLPCVDDVLELIWQSRMQNAGITCASDYMFHPDTGAPVLYDNWVARDINGTALENAPFEKIFKHEASSDRFMAHLPLQVQACWNGIAVMDPAPLYAVPHVSFRMADMSKGECSASECSLICNDYWAAGYGRIVMVPRVKLAYDSKVFDIIHPERRDLAAIRGYKRMGGSMEDPTKDPQDRAWFGPHDRLFVEEESTTIEFQSSPTHVFCVGWDGSGNIDGPDLDPVWEPVAPDSLADLAISVQHDRGF